MARDWLADCKLIAIDIETGCFPAQITCCGYTGIKPDGRIRSFVIPFYDEYSEGGVYWQDPLDHQIAFECMKAINANPALKTMQNGNYDSSYFIRDRAPVNNWLLDSMLMWY